MVVIRSIAIQEDKTNIIMTLNNSTGYSFRTTPPHTSQSTPYYLQRPRNVNEKHSKHSDSS